MKNINKMSDFDRHWKEVFGNAEAQPSDGVWDKIDSTLSNQEAGYFKKRAFLFKTLAAASIIFALGIGLFSINYYLDQERGQLTAEYSIDRIETSPMNEAPSIAELKEQKTTEQLTHQNIPTESFRFCFVFLFFNFLFRFCYCCKRDL